MSTKEDIIYVGVVNILSMEKIGNSITYGQPLSKSKCIRVYIDSLNAIDTVEGFKESEVETILDGLYKQEDQCEEFIRSFEVSREKRNEDRR